MVCANKFTPTFGPVGYITVHCYVIKIVIVEKREDALKKRIKRENAREYGRCASTSGKGCQHKCSVSNSETRNIKIENVGNISRSTKD